MNNIVILRRRKLGRGSTQGRKDQDIPGIANLMVSRPIVQRSDLRPKYKGEVDLTIRWGCTSPAPSKKVFNSIAAIQSVNDKVNSRCLLSNASLAPLTALLSEVMENGVVGAGLVFPVVVRPPVHAQGRHCYKCDNMGEVIRAALMCAGGYVSAYIPKVAEYRVFVAQGRAVWVANKTPDNPNAVAWNVAQGGRFDNVRFNDWPLKAVRIAIEAFNKFELDFGGVDVMVDANGGVFVLEINSAPSQTSLYRQTCVAKVFDYMIDNGKGMSAILSDVTTPGDRS